MIFIGCVRFYVYFGSFGIVCPGTLLHRLRPVDFFSDSFGIVVRHSHFIMIVIVCVRFYFLIGPFGMFARHSSSSFASGSVSTLAHSGCLPGAICILDNDSAFQMFMRMYFVDNFYGLYEWSPVFTHLTRAVMKEAVKSPVTIRQAADCRGGLAALLGGA